MSQPIGSDETRWLLGFEVGGPKWVKGFKEERYRFGGVSTGTAFATLTPIETTDVNDALQFARERDAHAMRESLTGPYHTLLRAEEHLWPTPSLGHERGAEP